MDDFEVLPNLETKFVVANTLIGLNLQGYGDAFTSAIILPKCKELTQIFLPFTEAKTSTEKEQRGYVPNKIIPPKDGYSDYIHLIVDTNGKITNW